MPEPEYKKTSPLAGTRLVIESTELHLLAAFLLIAATVVTHSAGIGALLWCMARFTPWADRRFGFIHNTVVSIFVITALLCVHTAEVAWWSLFYRAHDSFPDLATAFYFSMTTYATMGAGGLGLDREWRLIGGIEALTGLLMVGWSVAVLVRLASWIYERRIERWRSYGSAKEPDIVSLY